MVSVYPTYFLPVMNTTLSDICTCFLTYWIYFLEHEDGRNPTNSKSRMLTVDTVIITV